MDVQRFRCDVLDPLENLIREDPYSEAKVAEEMAVRGASKKSMTSGYLFEDYFRKKVKHLVEIGVLEYSELETNSSIAHKTLPNGRIVFCSIEDLRTLTEVDILAVYGSTPVVFELKTGGRPYYMSKKTGPVAKFYEHDPYGIRISLQKSASEQVGLLDVRNSFCVIKVPAQGLYTQGMVA